MIFQLLLIITPLILDQLTWSLHKKCNYFSQATRWNHSILSQSQLKWCFGTLNLYFYQKENWLFQTQLLNIIQIAKTLLLLGLRQKWMIPSCCPWKVVTFFGKDHVNWSSINGVMKGWSQKIKFGKLKIGVNKKILDFSSLIFQLHPIISTVILDQMACFLPKTNTKFHQLFKYVKKDAIFSSIRWENGRNIFGWRSLLGTVVCQ